MDKYINNILKSKFLKEYTKTLYTKHFDKIENEISKKPLIQVFNEPETFEKDLNNYCNSHTGRIGKKLGDHFKESYLTSILSLFVHNEELRENQKELYDKWKNLQKKIKQPIINKYNKNKPTKRQKKALISYEDLVNIRNNLKNGTIERLLFSMYIDIPPVRSDYNEVYIYKDDDTPDKTKNYIQNKTIYLHEFKTSKLYNEIIIPIPRTLDKEIKLSLKNNPRNFLFTNAKGKPYKRNTFNKWANAILKKLINKSFSLTMFRHIFISRKDLKLTSKSGLEKNKIASKMGHSIDTQQHYLWI